MQSKRMPSCKWSSKQYRICILPLQAVFVTINFLHFDKYYENTAAFANTTDCALIMFRYMIKGYLSEFLGKFLERETLQFIPECHYEWRNIDLLTTRYNMMLEQVPHDDRSESSFYCDWEEVEYNQLLSRFSQALINNAGIPLNAEFE
jgi:hypothetical protein